ncbi:helix-turn-helix domain-containing protein [Streptomyces sp. NPDC004134]|uniref:helix-turn-helix domain-containing protein n=1 Tax=Streptomyces sp. NPDC004134 TaxID=3364691 RepID=UPI0036CB3199
MIETRFHTDDLDPADRFANWRDLMAKTIVPMDTSSEFADLYAGRMRLLDLGGLAVWSTSLLPLRFVRTPRLIRQSDPGLYHLTLPMQGTASIAQEGREDEHGPRELYLVDTSRPFDCVGGNGSRGIVHAISLEVPKTMLPLLPQRIDRLLTRRISGHGPVDALLVNLLIQMFRTKGTYQPSDGPRLRTVVIDLLSAVIAQHLDAEKALEPESRTRTLTLRIRDFIRHHLHDPDLTPKTIATAHHISVSYLHRLFQAHGSGTPVSAWIRAQRLERAHHDLTDPAQATTPVHAIATRWGFTHHTSFTRAFTSHYGHPPADLRQQMSEPQPASPPREATALAP